MKRKIQSIVATKHGIIWHWNRCSINNIIENIPKLIKLEGGYKNKRIYYQK